MTLAKSPELFWIEFPQMAARRLLALPSAVLISPFSVFQTSIVEIIIIKIDPVPIMIPDTLLNVVIC